VTNNDEDTDRGRLAHLLSSKLNLLHSSAPTLLGRTMFLVENVLNLVVRLGNLWVILDVFEDTMGYGNDLIQDGPFGRVGPRPAPSVPSRSVYFQQLMTCAFSSKLPIFQRSAERLEPISYSESINCGDMAHFVSNRCHIPSSAKSRPLQHLLPSAFGRFREK
jgi:hypothetical protein